MCRLNEGTKEDLVVKSGILEFLQSHIESTAPRVETSLCSELYKLLAGKAILITYHARTLVDNSELATSTAHTALNSGVWHPVEKIFHMQLFLFPPPPKVLATPLIGVDFF